MKHLAILFWLLSSVCALAQVTNLTPPKQNTITTGSTLAAGSMTLANRPALGDSGTSAAPTGWTRAEIERALLRLKVNRDSVRALFSVAGTGATYDPALGRFTFSGGGSSGSWQTSGTITYNLTGSVGINTSAPNKLLHVAGAAQVDVLHFTGANSAETDVRTIKSLNGTGLQLNAGYIFNNNPDMITQGNANVNIGGNWFWKIGGSKTWFFHANGYLGVNIDTNTPTAYMDVNNGSGYDGLRLRNTYTPTASSDTNGQVGSIAWDASYIYVKTASGWKRTALSTF